MVEQLFKLRWLAAIVAVVSALHATAFVAIGILRGIDGYKWLFQDPNGAGDHSPSVHLTKSIDAFLLAMVFYVFSMGITMLFLSNSNGSVQARIPEWMRIKNLSELKFLIWEAILTVLVVASVEGFEVGTGPNMWTSLIPPIGILILAAGLYLARRAH
jgi:uncharacterized membrane protein YqhA